ncbi:tubulin-like doman-containing protein [Streptomyces cinnamoneus]|uniref:tubulin-like doman-containing protein n=1 Tax=Streptomyces cinnamoneus TaxID=53446 RepID=UPI0034316361
MRIFQPMLFVGLGGTGGLVGAELERRLRAELCGPDGTRLMAGGRRQRQQLPDCLQFVYADYSESELARLPHLSADRTLRQAYARTARATHDLLPADYHSSPEVTRMLRAVLREETAGWLPPRKGEPKVTPLRNGAGQLPTVGRAALFGTLLNGTGPVTEPLRQAIDVISRSGGELEELGGGPLSGCDVFVAFSVAGGTGAGIFLDYLHLIGQVFAEKNFTGARIYPLVVMPSAFPAEGGGGRAAELNAARAVVDLFRLVDEQNVPDAEADLGGTDSLGGLRIRYPETYPVRLDAGTVPTAFLFSRTAGIRPDDLRRSIVSLVMSLVGTGLGEGPGHADDDYQTFAANFINRGVTRRTRSASGIGHQGVSTSLVASMTAPLDELAELASARLLARAVPRLLDRKRPRTVETAPLVRQMFDECGLSELWRRDAIEVPDPVTVPRGGPEIEQALRNRLEDMQRLLDDLRRRAAKRLTVLAGGLAPRSAALRMLRRIDLFQLEGVVRGIPDDPDPVAALGFLGMLENRRQQPAQPPGVTVQPPPVPRVRGRLGGMSRPRWGDDDVVAVLEKQDRWYQWRARAIWHDAWNAQEPNWRSAAHALQADFGQLVDAFRKSVEEERGAFAAQVQELYDERTGVSYFLPPQASLGEFYEDLVGRLVESEGLRDNDEEDALLLRLVEADCWEAAFTLGRRDPAATVATVKNVLKERVQAVFSERGRQQRSRPLMPSLGTLLSAAAGDAEAAEQVSEGALEQFRFKLAGLLPAGFVPEGNGPLKVLVTYPLATGKEAAEAFLTQALPLPRDGRRTTECRGVDTDSITVVLFRSEMSVTEVPEARNVLRQWARAQRDQRPDDMLRWRQRLGYRDDWLASTEEDRTHILHRLLCAMWNDRIDYLGDAESPVTIRIRLHGEAGPQVPAIVLGLGEYQDEVSSWAGLLRAYERWALLDEAGAGDGSIIEAYCRQLMRVLPDGLETSGSRPSRLYLRFVHEVAPRQLRLLAERERYYGDSVAEWVRPLREFWARTLPDALDVPFPEGRRAVRPTLRLLEEWSARPAPPGAPDGAAGRRVPYAGPQRTGPVRRAEGGGGLADPRPAPGDGNPSADRWTPDDGWSGRTTAHGTEYGPPSAGEARPRTAAGPEPGPDAEWPAGPTAGRTASVAVTTVGAGRPPYPALPDEPSDDDGWPVEKSVVPWGMGGGDGEADWGDGDGDTGTGTGDGKSRGTGDGAAE